SGRRAQGVNPEIEIGNVRVRKIGCSVGKIVAAGTHAGGADPEPADGQGRIVPGGIGEVAAARAARTIDPGVSPRSVGAIGSGSGGGEIRSIISPLSLVALVDS